MHILYEDNHLIAVHKPANVPSQDDPSGDTSLLELTRDWIRKTYNKPGNVHLSLVHRLDRPVSGVMLFAKTSKAASRVSEQFRNKVPKKSYLALVDGVPRQKKATLVHFLKKNFKSNVTRVFNKEAEGTQRAELSYEVVEELGSQSLLAIFPKTGRKHQIRAQLSHIGHPVVGDKKYRSKLQFSKPGIALLAHSLGLNHPTRKDEWLEIETDTTSLLEPTH